MELTPVLRDQVLLNGTWDNGAIVPQYAGIKDFDQQIFTRRATVPAAWSGKTVMIEFGSVCFAVDVFVNDVKVVAHVGGWNPFRVDVTKIARPGESFALKVDVRGPKHPPTVDARGAFTWPVGGWSGRGGINDDVWLRAYGVVRIDDAFVQTSVKNKTLTVEYTLTNSDDTARQRTVRIAADALPAAGGAAAISFNGPTVTLAPGETKTVWAEWPWSDPKLWWPDNPALYHLQSRLIEAGAAAAVLDTETRRFGFREFAIQNNQFYLNDIRINLFGDYQVYGDTWYVRPELHTPERWPQTVDDIKAMNIRVLRWHHNPVPQYVLDVCDEKGLLICDESANYARSYHKETDQAEYLRNCKTWITPWIVADRNHPCIYLWNATNEMTYNFAGAFPANELEELGALIKTLDPTRPVGYDGDNGPTATALNNDAQTEQHGVPNFVRSELIDYHYPEGYNKEPVGSIYGWDKLVATNKPTGTGEVLHTRSPKPDVQTAVERNTWWLGVWLRGLRYTNWTNVKPACWWFAEKDGFTGARADNLRCALAPVALFDKDYDDLGIAPYVSGTTPGGTLPILAAGATRNGTLILYNDEFAGTPIEIAVALRTNGKFAARAKKTVDVPLGEHVDIPYSFTVPAGSGEMELVLQTTKNGVVKFEEVRRLMVAGAPAGAAGGAPTISF